MDTYWQHPEGFQLFYRHWKHPAPKAVLLLVHGMGEHTGRYEGLASFLAERSIAVLGADLPGFGKSSGKRGHARGMETYYKTIDLVRGEINKFYPGVPVFLFGQSMGGNIVLNYLLDRKPDVSGVLATSPWILLQKMPPAITVAIARLVVKIFPAFSQPNNLDPRDFSRDPATIEAYRADPLVHNRVSAGIGFALLNAGFFLNDYQGALPCPVLLTHGTADALTDPQATEAFANRVQGPVTLKLWDGLYHETHNEPEKAQVLEYLADWINRHLK